AGLGGPPVAPAAAITLMASAPALVPHEIAGCGHRRRHRLGRLGTKPAEDLVEPVLLLRRLGCTLHRHRRRLNRRDALDDGFLARLASLFLLLPDDVFFFGPLHHVEGRPPRPPLLFLA